ncbi:MAG TPA: aminoacyl-tRNA hydrolase [Nitrospirales bacterium]|nr:aminoacyl-tRNA hydrolase [Nitrospirales bacterium]
MRLGEIRSIATHLVVGLGNPGIRYEWTRHNIGFLVLDKVAEECGVLFQRGAGFLVGVGMVADEHVILVKPQTFMNNSGDVVTALYKESVSSTSDLVVIHDDLDLDRGRLKIQHGGGDGGHRGVESIIAQRKDNPFTRIRIGVGRPTYPMTTTDYVLSPMTEKDRLEFETITERATAAVQCLVCDGLTRAMNQFNSRKNEPPVMPHEGYPQ